MIDEFMSYEVKIEKSDNSDTPGSRVYLNGEKREWHYGLPDKSLVALLKRDIQRQSSMGGQVIVYHNYGKDDEYQVDPCPNDHATIVDDFMGGTLCKDCGVGW